ncbi:hypothetical protein SAMN05216276_103435 [Streptosporangium subroseum]|uniref:Uncharacterized protein n=1 Tax=Streptosporangium subroseum TaxID=106412 RepID=A0A239LPZ7_9ACTN|nr:hypothetical protein SAMN05216276_103435 [Streptosporangium subroseum]
MIDKMTPKVVTPIHLSWSYSNPDAADPIAPPKKMLPMKTVLIRDRASGLSW